MQVAVLLVLVLVAERLGMLGQAQVERLASSGQALAVR